MRSFLKSTFLWQFAVGFALGALGMVTLTPDAVAGPAPASPLPSSYAAR